MRKITRLLAILLCIPLLCSLFMPKEERPQREERIVSTAGFVVIAREETGQYCYDPEEILPYIMASMLADQKGDALYGASAIICRTNLVYTWHQSGTPQRLMLEDTGMSCQSRRVCLEMENIEELKEAAMSTAGIVLTYEGEVIPAPFFYMSAGRTRDGCFPFLQSAECTDDIYQNAYLQQYDYSPKDFYDKIKEASGWRNCDCLQDVKIEREDSGYVAAVSYSGEDNFLKAETVCEAFGLISPCFDWEEQGGRIVIRTRGIGHGVGFDVCYGACLAKKGMDRDQILGYFYKDVIPDKRYNVTQNLDEP